MNGFSSMPTAHLFPQGICYIYMQEEKENDERLWIGFQEQPQ